MLADEIKAIESLCRARWTYKIVNVQQWRSYGDDILAGKPWEGDCTDLASSVLDLAGRRGAPLDKRYRLLVSVAGTDVPDHMVGIAVDDTESWWVVGDSFEGVTGPYPAVRLAYTPCEYNRLSEVSSDFEPIWRHGLPWAVASPGRRVSAAPPDIGGSLPDAKASGLAGGK